jgi:integrase
MARDYGSGTITKHPNGTYQVRMRITDNGTVVRKSFGYFKSRQQAARALADLQTRYTDAAGRRLDVRHLPTVEALAIRWLDKAVAPGRHGTYRLYSRMLRDYILPVIGGKRLNELTRADVEEIQRQAHTKGLGPSSIELVLVVGHALLSYAANKEEIAGVKNPFHQATRLYRAKRRDYVVVSADEGKDLLAVLRPSHYAHAFALMLLCGLRVNEALGLRWRDIDLAHGRLKVDGQIATVDGVRMRISDTKTDSSHRILTPLPDPVVAALKAQRKGQMAEQASDLVFTAPDGRPASDRSLLRDFNRLVDAAVVAGELPAVLGNGEPVADMRLHDLRHSYATILLLRGIPLAQVSANLGHKNPAITLRVYSHVLPQSQQAAADAITQAFAAM